MTPALKKDLIRIDGVSHTFTTETGSLPVLDKLTFGVPENGFTAIVGPSGCGKSTVTRLVAGLLKPMLAESGCRDRKLPRPGRLLAWPFKIRCFWNGAVF